MGPLKNIGLKAAVRPTVVATMAALLTTMVASVPADSPAHAANTGVSMLNFSFSPDPVVVTVGDAITWSNSSGLTHTTTNGVRGSPSAGNVWNHVVSNGGSSPAVTFNTAGTFQYFCSIHFGMDGSVTVQSAAGPAAPTSLTAIDRPNDQGSTIDLSWTSSTTGGVTEQRLYRATSSGGYGATLLVTFNENTTNSHTDTGVTKSVTYYYVVRAFDGTSESADSNEDSSTPVDDLAPAEPTGLTATPGDQQASLDWNDNVEPDLDGYNVHRSTTSGTGYAKVNSSLVATSDYTDTGRANGTTYYYVVTAVDTSANESAFSTEASTTPSAPPTPTPVPNVGPWGLAVVAGLVAGLLLVRMRRPPSPIEA